MQTDLLRYISGPNPFALWWIVIGVLLIAVLVAWYVGVFVWTMPPARLRNLHGVALLHRRLLARRFARSVAGTTDSYRSGAITEVQACAGYSRILRSFLNVATGQRAQYMQTADLAAGTLAPAAPLIAALNDARFTSPARVDVERFGAVVEEMIRSWI
jgi:hypothetical protein